MLMNSDSQCGSGTAKSMRIRIHNTVGKKIFLLGPGSVEQCVADPGVLQVKENQAVVLAEQHAQPLRLNVLLHIKKRMKNMIP